MFLTVSFFWDCDVCGWLKGDCELVVCSRVITMGAPHDRCLLTWQQSLSLEMQTKDDRWRHATPKILTPVSCSLTYHTSTTSCNSSSFFLYFRQVTTYLKRKTIFKHCMRSLTDGNAGRYMQVFWEWTQCSKCSPGAAQLSRFGAKLVILLTKVMHHLLFDWSRQVSLNSIPTIPQILMH